MATFGEVLKRCRELGVGRRQSTDPDAIRNTWTQKKLAEELKLKVPDMIGRWEKNKSRPNAENFQDLRIALSQNGATETYATLLRQLVDLYNDWPGRVEDTNGLENSQEADIDFTSSPELALGPGSIVPGARYDVFISYAANDDATSALLSKGWVTEFVISLEMALKQRLGSAEKPAIYFPRRDLAANHGREELLEAIDASACMVALCSRSYVQRDMTEAELERLGQGREVLPRLFGVDVLPLEDEGDYPEALRHKHRLAFYAKSSPTSGVAIPLAPSNPEFHNLIHDLAEQIRSQLMAMRTVHEFSDAAQFVQDAAAGRPQVLLAQVTEDLEDAREDVRRYLEQFDHRVLPEAYYRQDGPNFRKQVGSDLARADLFVQLLGPSRGRCPPDLQDGYVRTQALLAKDAGVPIMQWRAATMDPSTIADPKHRNLLTTETVMASGLEAFKAAINEHLNRTKRADAKSQGDKALQTVFINADEPDLDYAKKVRDEFVRHGFLAATPSVTQKPDLLKEHLVDCDALVLLYGNASHVWADRNLRLFNKLRAKRERPPKVVAVLLGPPPENADELSIDMPGLRILGDRKQWNDAHLGEVIREMQNAKH